MLSLDFHGEGEVFFDAYACDDIKSSTAPSSARCSQSDQGSVSCRPDYELWISEPTSVSERRHRFLMGLGTGFAEPTPTGIAVSLWQGEIEADCMFRDLNEAFNRICSSYQSSFSQSASAAPDSSYGVRELDTENRSSVHEIEHDEVTSTSIPEEVGTDKTMDVNQSEASLSFSPLVHEFLRKGNGRCNPARGTNIDVSAKQKNLKSFCERFTRKKAETRISMDDPHVKSLKASTLSRTRVHQLNKKWMDFSAVYMCQEIPAHSGSIRVMKFSPSGCHLASVGEDCIVRIWMITEVESNPDLYVRDEPVNYMDRNRGLKKKLGKDRIRGLAIIPKKVFNISETPLHEFHGHTGDILDMAWSKSDLLLTASKDTTVRMWRVGCDDCLAIFNHNNYVTCVQFNPVDERYFASGSIDDKVRIWDVSGRRVADYGDTLDIVTALSYQPDGKGLIVSTVIGRCRFYDLSGRHMELEKIMKVKKRTARHQITRLQAISSASQSSGSDPSRVVIASAGSKIRVSEGAGISRKLKGRLWWSKVLLPPSLTPDGQYLVSAGRDSNVYIWNFDKYGGRSTKFARTFRSYERFSSKGVTTVAVWPGPQLPDGGGSGLQPSVNGPTLCRDRERCSFGTWFSADGMSGAATWPEEKLLPSLKYVNCTGMDDCRSKVSAAWNTVVVTGGRDGVIRCFHNYGLPVKL